MTTAEPQPAQPQARLVLDFWFGDAMDLGWPSQSRSALWFGGGPALDKTIDANFGDLVRAAAAGGLRHWSTRPLDLLALVILLDQFTRNVFRGTAQAFCGDVRAQELALEAMNRGWDAEMPLAGRVFLMLPLSHAESLQAQDRAVAYISHVAVTAPPDLAASLESHVQSAREHRDIIAAFGRFPHRNETLDRVSSRAELSWLTTGKRFGQ